MDRLTKLQLDRAPVLGPLMIRIFRLKRPTVHAALSCGWHSGPYLVWAQAQLTDAPMTSVQAWTAGWSPLYLLGSFIENVWAFGGFYVATSKQRTVNEAAGWHRLAVREHVRRPGGRYRKHGPGSGEAFYEEVLAPAYQQSRRLVVDLDGVLGYSRSFLDEAFGRLVADHGSAVLDRVAVVCDDEPELIRDVVLIMRERSIKDYR